MTRAFIIATALLATSPALAEPIASASSVADTQAVSAFERDRQSILAQAGQYRVRFDMRENVSFREGYEPMEEKLSGGNEIVRVIQDDGERISLHHILVIRMGDDGPVHIIKHWRQDWVYQPETVLTYAGPDKWVLTPVADGERRGAWSQTVWQTDDSPRYGGVGRWTYDHGLPQWTSGPTWRPLARRDAVRNPIYDRYLGTNRHALTPGGWVHIQDNMKMGPAEGDGDGAPLAIVQEDVINTYRASTAYDPKPGDDYWAATRDYWAEVRKAWDEVIVQTQGVRLEEAPNSGAVTGEPLMEWADQITKGELTTTDAVTKARELIVRATAVPAV